MGLVKLLRGDRTSDLFIGGEENPYLMRWYVIPRNPIFNIYLHKIVRDDDDRALHDHPWWSLSLLIKGELAEIDSKGKHYYKRWKIRLRPAKYAHRLMLVKHFTYDRPMNKFTRGPAWTLFITGPRIREWGFHCPQGWRHWEFFTDETGAKIGRGCE